MADGWVAEFVIRNNDQYLRFWNFYVHQRLKVVHCVPKKFPTFSIVT